MKGIIDTTLREGAQTAGVNFTFHQKVEIVKALAQVGIEEIELGIATMLDSELPFLLKESRKASPQTSYSLWSRCHAEDIEYSAKLMPDVLSLSVPVSDLHITKKLNKNRDWVVQTIIKSLRQAAEAGIKRISLGLEDATRAEQTFLQKVILTASEHGAERIRIADTVGISTPAGLIKTIQELDLHGLEVGVHTHNDFGMATANALSSLEAGAHWADTTVLGLGERTGNARLEELAGFLALTKGLPYRTEKLKPLCALVSKAASKPIDRQHPIVGENIFTCETGLHLQGLRNDPQTYEPYNPDHVGAERRLLYGAKIGRKVFSSYVNELAINTDKRKLASMFERFREKTRSLGRSLHDKEVIELGTESF